MPQLIINEQPYSYDDKETVLDALLRQEININHQCKKGSCHRCLLKSIDSNPPTNSQRGLKETLKQQGYFLSCLCFAEQDMQLHLPDQNELYNEGKVIAHQLLNHNTLLLRVQCPDISTYQAGQFVNLQRPDGVTRSYSIANSDNAEKILEFHIRRLTDGCFSEWSHNELKLNDTINISDPLGSCFYSDSQLDQNLLLVGTGTGLAPLIGIIKDALSQGHTGLIQLFHGSHTIEDLYYIEVLRQLEQQHSNFYYNPCVSSKITTDDFLHQGRANEVALQQHPDLSTWRVFLCGHPDMVTQMKFDCFMAGAASADIYSDPFIITPKS